MKPTLTIGSLAAFVLGAAAARGDLVFNVSAGLPANIPDGNIVGLTSVGSVSIPAGSTITSLTLDLNVSGGYNGDLYAYLEAPNGTTTVLFNRPGVTGGDPFGYGGSGLNITLSDIAGQSLATTAESSGAVVTGSFTPVQSFSAFNGMNGSGNWTLLIADDSAGGGQAVLNSWSLDAVVAVPEPGQTEGMLLLVVVGAGGIAVARWRRFVARERLRNSAAPL